MEADVTRRASLFVDHQNAYCAAREVFYHAAHCQSPRLDRIHGQFHPRALGELICAQYNRRHPNEDPLMLHNVFVYIGEPDRDKGSTQERKRINRMEHAEFQRRRSAWRRSGVVTRSAILAYDPAGVVRAEKEIDSKLVIDFVTGAIAREYDVGIIFSADRDFVPAIEYVRESHSAHCRADIAAWGTIADGKFMRPRGLAPVRHFVSRSDYRQVADERDYRRSRRAR